MPWLRRLATRSRTGQRNVALTFVMPAGGRVAFPPHIPSLYGTALSEVIRTKRPTILAQYRELHMAILSQCDNPALDATVWECTEWAFLTIHLSSPFVRAGHLGTQPAGCYSDSILSATPALHVEHSLGGYPCRQVRQLQPPYAAAPQIEQSSSSSWCGQGCGVYSLSSIIAAPSSVRRSA